MKHDDFVHLHNHSDVGSNLDGAGKLSEYVARAVDLGQKSLALTDHGTLIGSYAFQKEAVSAGINPIWGLESYMAPLQGDGKEDRFNTNPVFYGNRQNNDRSEGGDVSGNGAYLHLTLLAKNETGVHNLIKINSESWRSGVYRKGRADQSLLEQYSDGLIFLSGCPSGEIQTRLRLRDIEGAERYLDWAIQTFGRENVFLEVMDHDMPEGIEVERSVKAGLMYLHDRFKIPFVATNDSHYANPEHALRHEHLLCLQTGSNMNIPPQGKGGKRFALDGSGYYLKTGEEMMRAIPEEFVDACKNTTLIAEMCSDSRLVPKKGHDLWIDMSPYMPEEYAKDKGLFLLQKAKTNLKEIRKRLGQKYTQQDDERLEYEMKVIADKGYPDYFAFSEDFSSHMKENYKILFNPGRGSVGGSLISYALGITLLDPFRYGLFFERFLNPERDSPPDVDFDVPDTHVDILRKYVTEKYGEERVRSIGTIGKIKAKNSIRDAARILEYPYDVGDKLSEVVGDAKTLSDVEEELQQKASELQAEQVIEVAKGLEGLARQPGVHACGIIASSVPLDDMAPLITGKRENEFGEKEEVLVTQWEYPLLEELGFVKFDFLSLSNLSVVNETIKMVKKNHGVEIDAEMIVQGPMDDKKTYDLLNKGLTMGIFQLEGDGITELVKLIGTTDINDIAAILASYRPGPMGMGSHISYAKRKNGKEAVDYIHPEIAEKVKPILEKTYGLTLYQEQIMQMAQALANYSLADADILRRAIGKKKKAILDEQEEIFKSRMRDNGYSQQACDSVWDIIVPFSDYGFNASHAYGYALTTYITAYLKANYTAEFMASMISVFAAKKKKDKVEAALRECSALGINVLPPDINSAAEDASSNGKEIFLGFSSVANCGSEVAGTIVSNQPYTDFNDFTSKMGKLPKGINKACLESLANAGSFDKMSPSRASIILSLDNAVERMQKIRKQSKVGSETLFGDVADVIAPIALSDKIPEFRKIEKLNREKDSLGLYISGHPLDNAREYLQALGGTTVANLGEHLWENVLIGGMVISCETRRSKKGNLFSRLTLEDSEGNTVDALLFGDNNQEIVSNVFADDVVILGAKVRPSRDGGDPTLSIESVKKIPVDDDGNVVMPITISQGHWETFGQTKEQRLQEIFGDTLGGNEKIVLNICDFNIMKELGSKYLQHEKNHEIWLKIIEEASSSIEVAVNSSGIPKALAVLGRASFESWEWRLRESEQRWLKI